MRYRLSVASHSGVSSGGAVLADIVQDADHLDPTLAQTRIGPFKGIRKIRFYLNQDDSREIDLHAVHEDDDGTDLMIEVKDWQKELAAGMVRRFIEVKKARVAPEGHKWGEGQLKRQTVFLFYSESGLSKKAVELLREAGILVIDPNKLADFEVF